MHDLIRMVLQLKAPLTDLTQIKTQALFIPISRCKTTKFSHFLPSNKLVEIGLTQFFSPSPAKPVPINSLLMYFCHIFKKVVEYLWSFHGEEGKKSTKLSCTAATLCPGRIVTSCFHYWGFRGWGWGQGE